MTIYKVNFMQKQMTAEFLKANPVLKNKRKKVLSFEEGTLQELIKIYMPYLESGINIGKQKTCDRGVFDIDMNPKNIEDLVDALNKALRNKTPFHNDYEDRFCIAK